MENLLQEFRGELAGFREMTEKFYAGEVSTKEYKGFSGGFGSYAQKGGRASMLRLRLPGGRVTKEKLRFIADAIEEYGIDKVHFTTCQTVQFHNLSAKAACELMEKALDAGIVTRGGGGDFPRNVMASPLSGAEQGEYFDVLPMAEAVSDYLLGMIKAVKMPRKLKVCFSNSPANETHATFRDLGFAAQADGTFTVYSAGGLGKNPRMGVKIAEHVEPSDVLYYVKAMVDTFVAYGDYENRGRARTRYMQDKLGAEGYRAAFLEKLAQVKAEENLKINTEPETLKKTEDGTEASGKRIIPQKQEGLYAVAWHPLGGVPAVTKFGELYGLLRDMKDAELRIGPDETVYVVNLNGSEAVKVEAATEDGAQNLFETSVSCIGSSICQIGLRDSQGALAAVIEEVRKHGFADGVLPRIHISGCSSSCGTHQIGTLGFHGGVKRVDGVVEPAFTFHVNGSDSEGEERFGEEWGRDQMPPEYLPMIRGMLSDKPYIEGPWMDKHQGKYYLQYACPGTQYNIYADGVYVSDSPLGPFTLADNNPYSYKPGGFLPGAGHGSTMRDMQGKLWHTSTMRISKNHQFERRVGIWPAGFDADGELFCNQRYGDWPMAVEEGRLDPWRDPEWYLLSFKKPASASSWREGKEPARAVDENVQTWWQAASSGEGEWLQVDLEEICRVHGVQINFADDGIDIPVPGEIRGTTQARYIDEKDYYTRWILEGSADGKEYFTIEDKWEAETDLSHDLVVREEGLLVRFLKLTVREVPYGQRPCISGLRIFGCGNGEKPAAPEFEAVRENDLDMKVVIRGEGALGFNILWGSSPEKLYHSYMTFDQEQHVKALVKGREYYVRVDAFNENGITQGNTIKLYSFCRR